MQTKSPSPYLYIAKVKVALGDKLKNNRASPAGPIMYEWCIYGRSRNSCTLGITEYSTDQDMFEGHCR